MKVCGAYRHVQWLQSGSSGYVRDSEAFIFSINLKKKYIVYDQDFAAYSNNGAPQFGYDKNHQREVLGLQGSETESMTTGFANVFETC